MSEQPWSDEAKAVFLAFCARWEKTYSPEAYESPEWESFCVAAPWARKVGAFEIPDDVVAKRVEQAQRKAGL